MGEEVSGNFLKKDNQVANKYMKMTCWYRCGEERNCNTLLARMLLVQSFLKTVQTLLKYTRNYVSV